MAELEDRIEIARSLIEEGLTLVPAHVAGKYPLVKWQRYQTEDPEPGVVDSWFLTGRFRGCNWAIITGKQIVVIDADSEEAVSFIRSNLTYTPRTVRTARGIHFYYRANPSYPVPCGVNPEMKIDVRGVGGVVIAPGSVHESGTVYEQHIDSGVDGDWRELPELSAGDLRLISEFNVGPKEVGAGSSFSFDASAVKLPHDGSAVDVGGRNNAAASMAGQFVARGMELSEVVQALLEWNSRNEVPLPTFEIQRTAESVFATDSRNKAKAEVEYEAAACEAVDLLRPSPFVLGDPSKIPPRQWVYGRYYIRQFLSVTVAPGGVGKTALTLCEAICMASGRDLLGVSVAAPRRVWVWNLEDPMDELTRRISAICLHYGISQEELRGRLYVNSGRDTSLVLAESVNGQSVLTPAADVVTDHINRLAIDVVMVDPFISSHKLSENDNNAMDLVVKRWAQIAHDGNCSIELVHHVRKGNGADASVTDARGASALIDAARHGRRLQKMTAEEGRNAGLEEDEFWAYFREADSKDNLAPPAADSNWRRLVSVDLGNGDSVGVIEGWSWPDPFSDVRVADLRAVQRAVYAGVWRESPRSNDWVGLAVADALDLDVADDSVRAKVRALVKTWVANKALRVVEDLDESRRKRKFVRVGEWVE